MSGGAQPPRGRTSPPSAPAQGTPHWRKVHKRKNTDLLFAEDLGPPGTRRDVEITQSGVLQIKGQGGKSDQMPWIGTGRGKRFGLNITNCKTMEAITGTSDYTRWRGPITLVVCRIEYQDPQNPRQRVSGDAIRIAPTRPRPHPDDPKHMPEEPAESVKADMVVEDEGSEGWGADAPGVDAPDAAEAAEIAASEAAAAREGST